MFVTPQVWVLIQTYFSSLNSHSTNKKLPNCFGCFNKVNVSIFHEIGTRNNLQYFGHLTAQALHPTSSTSLPPQFIISKTFCICHLNIAISCIGQLFLAQCSKFRFWSLHFLGQISVHISRQSPLWLFLVGSWDLFLISFLRITTSEKTAGCNLPKCQFCAFASRHGSFMSHVS